MGKFLLDLRDGAQRGLAGEVPANSIDVVVVEETESRDGQGDDAVKEGTSSDVDHSHAELTRHGGGCRNQLVRP